jgi:hypothetical protein
MNQKELSRFLDIIFMSFSAAPLLLVPTFMGKDRNVQLVIPLIFTPESTSLLLGNR